MEVNLNNISKAYSGNWVLKDVSLRIKAGQIHALVGENGAGKSTLMKILIGVETPDRGEVQIDGQVKRWSHPMQAREAGIAMVYQELSLVPSLSVFENIFLGRLLRRRKHLVDWVEMKQRAVQLFEELEFSIDIHRPIEALSIAEKQMVEIARALAQNAALIILDEPTSSLSDHDTHKLFKRMQILRDKGVSLVFITHRLQEVFDVAEHVSVLRDGELVDSRPVAELNMDTVIRQMVGRELREQFPPRAPHAVDRARPPLLRVEGITREPHFREVSFSVRRGEILGFAGLVGSGRTEVMEAIFGVNQITSGRIEINGKVVRIQSPTEGVGAGLGLIPDDRKGKGLVTEASVLFNLVMASQLRFATRWGWRIKRLEGKAAIRLVSELKIRLASPEQPTYSLSGGNQQKVAIGKTLNTESSILIFDEPTRGIDVGAKREIYYLIRELAQQQAAILLVSSELEELLGLSDRIIVMHQGRVAGELPIESATQERIMQLAVGVEDARGNGSTP